VDLEEFLIAAGDLLAMPSTADRPDELRRALEFVIGFVGPGFRVDRFESAGKTSALVYRATGPDGAPPPRFRVILNGHLDVVPGDPEQFRPRRDGDRLYARGAQDMKVSALVQAQVFRELAATLPYPIGLQLVTDEEVGGRNGTLHQLSKGVTGEFVVIGEHSGLDVVADSKGLLHARLLAAGRGAHSAYPWLGDNALDRLVTTVARLLARYPRPSEVAWHTTLNLARIDTPNRAFNQVPAYAEAWLDIRFPTEDGDLGGRTVEEVTQFLGAFCESGVVAVVDQLEPAHHSDHDRPEVGLLQQAARRQGYRAEFLYKHGAGDGRFYAGRGIDAVVFGVGGDGQHGPQEYVDVTTVLPYHAALTEFLEQLTP
jgi:succinyl-diaminopimelate desuccinylase